jgi:hypothetical protein
MSSIPHTRVQEPLNGYSRNLVVTNFTVFGSILQVWLKLEKRETCAISIVQFTVLLKALCYKEGHGFGSQWGGLKLRGLSELYWPSDRHLSAKLVPTFADRGMRGIIFFNLPNPSGGTRPGVHTASKQKWVPEAEKLCFLGVKCGWCVRLTTLPPFVSW